MNDKYQYAVPLDSHTSISQEEFENLVPVPAKSYPFELDTFQKQAIIHIEKGENVFVSAHTSAGKTVVAEYAIALSFTHKTQVIYTSPIKALSNQKFRDFALEFNDVGIITGDVQLNTKALCLVMTTEILLQMLYVSSEIINHLEYVIFDECHYINDSKRGHVWEEVFILLPSSIKLVLLSATVPNVIEFSDWLGRIRQRQIYVISTTKRPVPLKHYLYLGRDGKTKDQQLLILEGNAPINETNHKKAMDILNQFKAKLGYINRTFQTERNIYLTLIRHLQKNDKLPVICFTLSRKRCDQNLEMLLSIKEENISLITKRESYIIKKIVYKHLKSLKKNDLGLEQVKRISTMLTRGFSVHHSGILPILKELTEILFNSGLVKVLFATETFAMGVNMPARTVVFDSLTKPDLDRSRLLKPAEYIQMAGRAGRRGKDKEGTVIILSKYEVPSLVDLNMIMKGSAESLESQFRLTYYMILNMLKSQTCSIERFLKNSFREHDKVLHSSKIETSMKKLCLKINQLPELTCEICVQDMNVFYSSLIEFKHFKKDLMPIILIRASDKKFLSYGRLILFEDIERIFHCGILLKLIKNRNSISELIVLSLNDQQAEIKTIPIEEIFCILNKQIKGIDTNTIIEENDTKSSLKNKKIATEEAIQKLQSLNLPENFDLLMFAVNNFISHEKLGKLDPDMLFMLQKYSIQFKQLANTDLKCIKCKQFLEHYHLIRKRSEMENNKSKLDYVLSNESLELLPDYRQRINILKTFNFIDEQLVLLPKGHIASFLTDNELLITEIVFENLLGNLSVEAIPAALSCFVLNTKQSDEDSKYIREIPELDEIIKKIVVLCVKFGKAEQNLKLEESDSHYFDSLNFDSVRAVYEWAKGKNFSDIMKYTTLQEGIIVRCIQRVDELIKNIRIAVRNLELIDFQAKLERSSNLIRRDIAFIPSLYTSQELIRVIDNNQDTNENDTNEPLEEFFNYHFEDEEQKTETLDEEQTIETWDEEQFSSHFL